MCKREGTIKRESATELGERIECLELGCSYYYHLGALMHTLGSLLSHQTLYFGCLGAS